MLKKYKKNILINKKKIFLPNSLYTDKIKKSINSNLNLQNYFTYFYLKWLKKKNYSSICKLSGKKKSILKRLKLNRRITNDFLQYNFFPNLKNL